MEAVKQGSATVGLKSSTHAVLVALKRASSDLSSHQKKILPIDDHVGVSIAGLTADARTISRWMRTECMNREDLLRLVETRCNIVRCFISAGQQPGGNCNISLTDPPMLLCGSAAATPTRLRCRCLVSSETSATRCRSAPSATASAPTAWGC